MSRSSREVVRVRGELVERGVPVARPVPFDDRLSVERPVVHYHDHRPPAVVAPVRHGWLVLAYLVGLVAMGVLVVFVLSWVGVLDWGLVDVPWKPAKH